MNKYLALRERQSNEIHMFPMFFSFSEKQFKDGLEHLGVKTVDEVTSIGIGGGFVRKSDVKLYESMLERHYNELMTAIEQDKTGDGFIYDMFDMELANHEYGYTMDFTDAIYAVGLSITDIENSPALQHGLAKACADQLEWYRNHG